MTGLLHPQHEQPIMSRRVAIHVKIYNAYAKSPTSVANGNGWSDLVNVIVDIAKRDSAGFGRVRWARGRSGRAVVYGTLTKSAGVRTDVCTQQQCCCSADSWQSGDQVLYPPDQTCLFNTQKVPKRKPLRVSYVVCSPTEH